MNGLTMMTDTSAAKSGLSAALPTAVVPVNKHLAAQKIRLQRLLGFLQQDPKNQTLIHDALSLALDLNADDDVKHLLQHALAMTPQALEALLSFAVVTLEAGHIEAAGMIYRQLTKDQPLVSRAWIGLAQVMFHELDMAAAREYLQKALVLAPKAISAWQLIVWVYILQRDAINARLAVTQYALLAPTTAAISPFYAIIEVLEGHDASAYFQRALAQNPDDLAACYGEILSLEFAKNHPQALNCLQQFLNKQTPNGKRTGHELLQHWHSMQRMTSPKSTEST